MSVGDAHAAIDAAVQAVRDEYRADLDRLGDERDALVAQHDRDAETIAELRDQCDSANTDAINHWHKYLRAEQERDKARSMLALAEGVAAALPDPDAQNPEHCQFAAELSAQLPPTGPNEDWEWTTAHRGLTARQWAERAKSLEAAQSAEAQRDREIEAVAKAFDQAVESDVTDRDAAIAAIDALDAARSRRASCGIVVRSLSGLRSLRPDEFTWPESGVSIEGRE